MVLWLVDRVQFVRFTTALMGMALVAFVIFLLVPTAPPGTRRATACSAASPRSSAPRCRARCRRITRTSTPTRWRRSPRCTRPSHSSASWPCCACIRAARGWPSRWCLLVWFSVVFLGEHYVIDVIGGVVLAGAVVAGDDARRRAAHRRAAAPRRGARTPRRRWLPDLSEGLSTCGGARAHPRQRRHGHRRRAGARGGRCRAAGGMRHRPRRHPRPRRGDRRRSVARGRRGARRGGDLRVPPGTHIVGLFLERQIRMHMSAEDTVDAIHEQGGLAIVAHPFMPTYFASMSQRRLDTLLETRTVDGIELRHTAPVLPGTWKRLDEYYAAHRDSWGRRWGRATATSAPPTSGGCVTVFEGAGAAGLRTSLEARTTSPRAGTRPTPPGTAGAARPAAALDDLALAPTAHRAGGPGSRPLAGGAWAGRTVESAARARLAQLARAEELLIPRSRVRIPERVPLLLRPPARGTVPPQTRGRRIGGVADGAGRRSRNCCGHPPVSAQTAREPRRGVAAACEQRTC